MASVFISSPAEVVVIDSRTKSGTITLPITNSIPYRVLSFKDQYGSFSNSTLTLSTQLGESFDDGLTTKIFSNSYGYASLYATSSKWLVMNATTTVQQTISSLNVNQLTFGTGTGWVQFGPLQATVVSTIQVNTNSDYVNNLYLGNTSTATALQYWGLFGNYNNTVLAEISTSGGVQEFLVFKGSSASDRVRVQTTGNFVVETGVSSRLWSNTTIPTLSNVTPAFIINTSSNVGIQTASPATTLDVAGTGRFQILSTLNINVSSINGQTFGGPINSTSIGLGTLGYISSSQLISSMTGVTNTDASNFNSTIRGLGSSGYISSAQLLSTTTGLIDIPELQSTIQGLGSASYISSSQLISTTAGLLASASGVTLPSLVSSVAGLGSAGYISTTQLISTVGGLGGAPVFLGSNISAFYVSAGYMTASSITTTFLFTSSVYFSSLSTNIINFAGGFGYLTLPDILPNTVYTSTVTASNYLVGWNANQSPIQYFGNGSYVNSVLAEVSTGATTQELLFFRGSNAADRIRMQTTGTIIFEPGVSARLWPTAPSNVTPAMIINASSNVGIQTASPGTALDVVGQIRGTTLSTIQFQTSSISAYVGIRGAFVYSSFVVAPTFSTFLGGSLSTTFLTAGLSQIDFLTNGVKRLTVLSNGFVGISTTNPAVTLDVAGTGRFQNLSTLNISLSTINGQSFGGPINSTVIGLGASGYISSSQLLSSITGVYDYLDLLETSFSNYVGDKLVSSVTGLDNQSGSNFISTTKGLGSAGYISTATGGGGGGAIDYVSAFTVSTSYLEVSSISSYAIYSYGVIATQLFNVGPENMFITSLTDATINANSTIITTNAFHLTSSNDARFSITSNLIIDAQQITISTMYCYDTISTHTLSVYGSNTLVVNGVANIEGPVQINQNTVIQGTLASRDRFTFSTLGMDTMYINPDDLSMKFFLIGYNCPQDIIIPDPVVAGAGWNILIQNNMSSGVPLSIYDPSINYLTSISPGQTVNVLSDGTSGVHGWYFY